MDEWWRNIKTEKLVRVYKTLWVLSDGKEVEVYKVRDTDGDLTTWSAFNFLMFHESCPQPFNLNLLD